MCVRVCVGGCASVCVCVRVCECACVRVRADSETIIACVVFEAIQIIRDKTDLSLCTGTMLTDLTLQGRPQA